MKRSKRLSRIGVFLLLKMVSGIARFLPWRLGVRLGGVIGLLFFYVSKRYRDRSFESFKIAFGRDPLDNASRRIIRRSFRNLGKSLLEILMFQYCKPGQIDSLVSWEGEEYLKDQGEGVLLITGHIGNWELLGAALAARGYRLHTITAPLYYSPIDDWITELRVRSGIKTISRGSPSSSRKILDVLRKREMLAILLDLDTRVNGVFVNFFNRKAHTPAGAAQLALRSGAKTVTAFITRLSDDRHRIIVEKPVLLSRTGDRTRDIETNTALFTERIEKHIRAHPDQWVWMHQRWKTMATNERESS